MTIGESYVCILGGLLRLILLRQPMVHTYWLGHGDAKEQALV